MPIYNNTTYRSLLLSYSCGWVPAKGRSRFAHDIAGPAGVREQTYLSSVSEYLTMGWQFCFTFFNKLKLVHYLLYVAIPQSVQGEEIVTAIRGTKQMDLYLSVFEY